MKNNQKLERADILLDDNEIVDEYLCLEER
jgi:hypothetical protein